MIDLSLPKLFADRVGPREKIVRFIYSAKPGSAGLCISEAEYRVWRYKMKSTGYEKRY